MDRARLGYVGVGLMGLPMVKRLVSLGYPVAAYDIGAPQMAAARAAGARAASSAADAARDAPFVLLNLPTTKAVEAGGVRRSRCRLGHQAASARRRLLDGRGRQRQGVRREALRDTTGCGWVDAPVSGGRPRRARAR